MQHAMLHSQLNVQRDFFYIPSLNEWIIRDVVCYMHGILLRIYVGDIVLSFTAGDEPLPDKVVVSMTQLCTLYIRYLPLPVLKALAERKEPLETFIVGPPPGVNWVSNNVYTANVRTILYY